MAQRKRTQTRNRKRKHQLELAVSSGNMVGIVGALCAALKPKKTSVKEVIIIMALTIALLAVAYVVVSAIRGEK